MFLDFYVVVSQPPQAYQMEGWVSRRAAKTLLLSKHFTTTSTKAIINTHEVTTNTMPPPNPKWALSLISRRCLQKLFYLFTFFEIYKEGWYTIVYLVNCGTWGAVLYISLNDIRSFQFIPQIKELFIQSSSRTILLYTQTFHSNLIQPFGNKANPTFYLFYLRDYMTESIQIRTHRTT